MKILDNGQGLIIGFESINLEEFPDLKVIGCPMTGLDHLPWKEIEDRKIKVISLKDCPEFLQKVTSTAEHTIGLMIALLRNYKSAFHEPYFDREFYKGHTLKGKTLGIIGYGRIGKQVAKIAKAFGMKVLAVDKDFVVVRGKEQIPEDFTIQDALVDILQNSDIISCHIPLQGNEGFFRKELFQKMKPTSYWINTSRDQITERGALKWTLENKIIAGAAVDFIDDPELIAYARKHKNLILSNHIGGCTYEDMEKTKVFIAEKVATYIKSQYAEVEHKTNIQES